MILDRPYVSGSATSYQAAESVRESALDMRARVFAAIYAAGQIGLTRDEITEKTGIPANTVRPRVGELLARRLITVSDEIRRSTSGRACEVLVAVQQEAKP